jgi:exopolysaccharide biosynthesis polyprenyl glycosylphosphotransferase
MTASEGSVSPDQICGDVEDLSGFLAHNDVDQVIVTDSTIGHDRIVEILLLCEKNLITFNMVPDLFRILTSSMDVQSLEDIPLLGIGKWPLDLFWNRVMKRAEDIVGALVGLIVVSPVLLVAGIIVKLTSPGPVFYKQDRCGEEGHAFPLYKLRTMRIDAEKGVGPVFAKENDPRTTAVGAFLRRYNLDELPQLWNVLKGEMSLVGPRPERPHFVQQFKEDIARYMWRHVSKPGLTGWAQVNGLRGNTSISERIKYDLYYLENWSLAFDFKILVRTIFATENAY